MKKNLLLILGCLIGFTLTAQEEETLLGNKARVIGGFGGFNTHVALTEGQHFSGGGFGGATFGDFFIGGFGYGSNSVSNVVVNDQSYDQNLGMGGLMIGFVYPNNKLFHFYSQLRAGWGGVSLQQSDTENELFDDSFFGFIPEVGIEINVTSWFRIAATGGYQIISGIGSNDYISNNDLMYPVAGLNFRFGVFSGN